MAFPVRLPWAVAQPTVWSTGPGSATERRTLAKQYPALRPKHMNFIERQKIFFTATAAPTGRVNVSPRGTDAFRVLGDAQVCYLDRTGSGNETAAHMKADGRMTIMFCAVEGPPRILRLYGRGEIIHRDSEDYTRIVETLFDGQQPRGARQIVRLTADLVQSSCGFAVPFFDYQGERDGLDRWAADKTDDDFRDYWAKKNTQSLDGLPTGILEPG